MSVSPGLISSDLCDDSGAPKTHRVKFVNGVAEVPDNLGRWMIDTGRASEFRYTIVVPETSSLILPSRRALR